MLIEGAPLGMRTLDPHDLKYNGYYNQLDGDEFNSAGGFNYHNGPEWVWPLGYFLRAKLNFFNHTNLSSTAKGQMVHKFLRHHRTHISTSHFRGLPELTNRNGQHCPGSCEVQAWSSACILDALHQLQ